MGYGCVVSYVLFCNDRMDTEVGAATTYAVFALARGLQCILA
mgnify:CR=1 FL=1